MLKSTDFPDRSENQTENATNCAVAAKAREFCVHEIVAKATRIHATASLCNPIHPSSIPADNIPRGKPAIPPDIEVPPPNQTIASGPPITGIAEVFDITPSLTMGNNI